MLRPSGHGISLQIRDGPISVAVSIVIPVTPKQCLRDHRRSSKFGVPRYDNGVVSGAHGHGRFPPRTQNETCSHRRHGVKFVGRTVGGPRGHRGSDRRAEDAGRDDGQDHAEETHAYRIRGPKFTLVLILALALSTTSRTPPRPCRRPPRKGL